MKYSEAEAMFFENYLISDFPTNTVISNRMDIKKIYQKVSKNGFERNTDVSGI